MAIIQTIQTTAPLSTEEKQTLSKAFIRDECNNLWAEMLRSFNSSMRKVWANDLGLTAQQVFDAFGNEAAELARLAGVLKTAINAVQDGTITASPNFTANDDGTVTVSA